MKVMYKCQHCGVEKKLTKSVTGKFCSNKCQASWTWLNETIPRLERGEGSATATVTLRRYLIYKFGNECTSCGLQGVWKDKPITLHVDHIDGNSDNNFPSNLRLLCPNCHSQTETFGRKGSGSRYKKLTKRAVYNRQYRSGSLV